MSIQVNRPRFFQGTDTYFPKQYICFLTCNSRKFCSLSMGFFITLMKVILMGASLWPLVHTQVIGMGPVYSRRGFFLISELKLCLVQNTLKVLFPHLQDSYMYVWWQTILYSLWAKKGELSPPCLVWTWNLSSSGPFAHLLKCPFCIARSGFNMKEQGTRAGGWHPPVGSVHRELAFLPFRLVQASGCVRQLSVASSSRQGFGLSHPEILLKLQESSCPLHLVKVGAASGLPLVRQEST